MHLNELEKAITNFEKYYGFSLLIEKEEEEKSIKVFATITPINKYYDSKKMNYLAQCFEKTWRCNREKISSKFGETYLLSKQKLK
jgi:hypothetical protein